MHAHGTFEVTVTPRATDDDPDGTSLGRASLEKRFDGDLQATGEGEMLTAITGMEGSAGYVALERVRGTLAGRSGSFVLQHSGTMARGDERLSVTVVPDSGTGELAGLTGTMSIENVDGEHTYSFEYGFEEDR